VRDEDRFAEAELFGHHLRFLGSQEQLNETGEGRNGDPRNAPFEKAPAQSLADETPHDASSQAVEHA
jgi:hypothetical protein